MNDFPEQGPEQPSLFGDPDAAHAARVAFGRYLRPDFYVDDPTFEALPNEYKEWFDPTQIEIALFRPPKGTHMTVRIDPENWRRSPYLSLNQEDFALVGRFPVKLAESAIRQTLAAGEVNEERVAAATRSGIHAVEARQEATEKHITAMQERKEQLDLFAKKARAAGWAHLKSDDMQELFNLCSQELITIMDILQIREEWTDAERENRYAGMMYYLTQGSQRTRVEHWRATIATVRRYLSAKIHLFDNHLVFNQKWLDEQQPDDETEPPIV